MLGHELQSPLICDGQQVGEMKMTTYLAPVISLKLETKALSFDLVLEEILD